MNYFTEDHEHFRQSLRAFLEKEVTPFVDEWEEAGEMPRSIWKKFGDMGYFGIPYAEKYGGLDLDFMGVTVSVLTTITRHPAAPSLPRASR